MIRHSSGILTVPMTGERLDQLDLPMMVLHSTDVRRTAFTVSVDARQGTTTGISAADRTRTIQVLIDPETKPDDLARPGHVYPLRYEPGGVLKRAGHTEAAVDLVQSGRSLSGRGTGRDHERRRHGRPAARTGALRQGAQPPDREHRRPDRLPAT